MMPPAADPFAASTYTLGALGYFGFAVLLGMRVRGSRRAGLLLGAVVLSTAWALTGAAFALHPSAGAWLCHALADSARFAAWGAFVAALLPPADPAGHAWRRSATVAGVSIALAAVSCWAALAVWPRPAIEGWQPAVVFGLWVCAAVLGLSVCEQLFRLTHQERRWAVKPLCLALAALCGFDLFMYSDATLLRRIDHEVWSVRGLAHAMTIPLVMLATARNRQWTIDIGMSRRAVFGSLALLLSGIYLLAIASVGYVVRAAGGDWGRAFQLTFLFAAVLLLAFLFFSGTIRSRLRVFVSKHFFSYRYDYREEWLKFTARLADDAPDRSIGERTVKAFADLLDSPAGALWLRREDGALQPAGSWNMHDTEHEIDADSPLVTFLERRGWILDLTAPVPAEASEQRERPPLPDWLATLPDAWLVIPLPAAGGLVGLVLLGAPRTPAEINWEVRDLLKTAARQAAAFLGHVRTAEALAEARQFEAFNRMSAFVVHDLKNLVAQLTLMVRNAERHGANPDFQKDMLGTAQHVVERMNRLLLQLRSGTAPVEKPASVELAPLLARVCAPHAGQHRVIRVHAEPGVRALGHEDRLERVVGHLLQNAIDATAEAGTISLKSARRGAHAVISVVDDGHGMSSAFLREQLFKPFRSTKANGMGIGAYESHQYVSELGGRICVESASGAGTSVHVYLPLAGAEPAVVGIPEPAARIDA